MFLVDSILGLISRWRRPSIDPIALVIPLPQALILIELDRHITAFEPKYDELLSPKELYEKLSPYSRGEWYEFYSDLEMLHARLFLVLQNDKVLLSPRGSYIARERQKKLYND